MPRPLGKYFSATIAKFRTFKEQEHIEIDENLRLQLRNNLLTLAGASKGKKNPGIVPTFGERFTLWKQYIPILPSLFLLIVTAFAFNKLPVTFEISAVVPKISSERKEEKPILPSVQSVPIKTQEVPVQLPTGVFSSEQVVEETQKAVQARGQKSITRSEESSQEVSRDTFSTKLPDATEIRTEEKKPQPMPFVFTAEPKPKSDTRYSPPAKPSQETKQPELSPAPAPNLPIKEEPAAKTTPRPQQSFGPGHQVPEGLSINKMENPNISSPTAEPSKEASQAAWEPPKIYFNGKFSRDERILLKNDFISDLVEGKNVNYVSVNEGPNEGFAVVEIYLEDGNVDTHIYNFHERTPN